MNCAKDFTGSPFGGCGPAFWDSGETNPHGVAFSKSDPGFYASDLTDKLRDFQGYLGICEWQKEASYIGGGNSWSDLDLLQIPGFLRFLINCEFWALHIKSKGIDISSPIQDVRRAGLSETLEAIRFGIRNHIDAMALHPGSATGWPSPAKARRLTAARAGAFIESLREISACYCREISLLIHEIDSFRKSNSSDLDDLSQCFDQMNRNNITDEERFRLSFEISRIVCLSHIPVGVVRHALNPGRTISLCLENVEPPNFLINTPAQHSYWHQTLAELYQNSIRGFSQDHDLLSRFAPKMLVDVNHYLHSKKILTEQGNERYADLFPDYPLLSCDFIRLPCDCNKQEPLLNRCLREHSSDIRYIHAAGCEMQHGIMHTHEPVKPIRRKAFLSAAGNRFTPLYLTGQFNPDYELDLEEVLQLIPGHLPMVLEIFDYPPEVMKSSLLHAGSFRRHFLDEKDQCLSAVISHWEKKMQEFPEHEKDNPRTIILHRLRERLSRSEFFMLPDRTPPEPGTKAHKTGFYLPGPVPEILAWCTGPERTVELLA
ncbi:MAG: hypothetical protein PHQ23_13415 [Candidatus Wallbacteria bacterium]|nr:hypothetical protein [Candidatus Wallbacteria bacterium]